MSDPKAAGAALAALLLLCPLPAAAQATPVTLTVRILDLPFKATAMRGPGSEVALAVATSGLIPLARPKPASADPKAQRSSEAASEPDPAPIAVVWGEGGGAVLGLADGAVRATLVGAEAIEGLALAETPRGALPGSHRALSGGLSAYLSGPARAGGASGLTVRERRPVAVTAEPKAVPVASETVAPGPDLVFAPRRPRIARIDGRAVILAVAAGADGTSALALLGKDAEGRWSVAGRSAPQAGAGPQGAPLAPAAFADLSGKGRPEIAAVRAPDGTGTLQLWTVAQDGLRLAAEAPGYAAAAPGGAELAAVVEAGSGGAELALPTLDRGSLALLSLHDGIRERARAALPSPAALGVAVLGRGAGARILVGLSDGRIAVAEPAP